MTFFSVLFALFAEQYAPVGKNHWVMRICRYWVMKVPNLFDTGEDDTAKVCITVLLVPPVFVVLGVHLWLVFNYPLFALVWNVMIVYCFMGFRQFSHHFTKIQEFLNNRQIEQARQELSEWVGPSLNTETLSESDVVRHTLERAILAVHSHVFGVFFWFLVPIGPAGVVMYRLSLMAQENWKFGNASPVLMETINKWRYLIDWVPTRLTAVGFTIVGNFEKAVYAWRFHQQKWDNQSAAILIGTGGGALGVQLGEPLAQVSSLEAIQMDDEGILPIQEYGMMPVPAHLASGASLVWRAIVLWMILLAMLSVAVWI
jgi:adenosylcobinamide-phosphate synthase